MLELIELYPELDSIIDYKLNEISQASANEIGPLCEELSVFYRTAAIGALLLEVDSDRFYHMLMRSGFTRVFFLRQTASIHEGQLRYRKTTRSNGFVDSVAAGRFDVATNIGMLSPSHRIERYEYEDDYYYVLFLHELIRGVKAESLLAVLAAFKTAATDDTNAKYDVCSALLNRDKECFDAGFSRMLEERTKEIEFHKRSSNRNEAEFASAQHVYVEGLAILRVALWRNIPVQEEYIYCPKEARFPMLVPFADFGYPK